MTRARRKNPEDKSGRNLDITKLEILVKYEN
jgi:hypothetical protein